MNREEIKQAIEAMQGCCDGKSIESRERPLADCSAGAWEHDPYPDWAFDHYEYRIKPEPREGWVRAHEFHDYTDSCKGAGCIHVREVIK